MSEFLRGKSTNGAGPSATRLPGSDTAQVRSQQPEAQTRIIAIIEPTKLVSESLVQLIEEASSLLLCTAFPLDTARPIT